MRPPLVNHAQSFISLCRIENRLHRSIRGYTETLLADQRLHSVTDFIPNCANFLYRLTLWIAERPVVATKTWYIGTLIATAHCDEELGVTGQFLCQFLGLGVAQVDSNLLHDREYLRMDAKARIRSRRDGLSVLAIGKLVEEGSCHLRSACVMNAGKNDLIHSVSLS